MTSSTYAQIAESFESILRPDFDGEGFDYRPVIKAMSGMSAAEIERMRSEVRSLVGAGFHAQAAERLLTFLRPKFGSRHDAQAAYEKAMSARRAAA